MKCEVNIGNMTIDKNTYKKGETIDVSKQFYEANRQTLIIIQKKEVEQPIEPEKLIEKSIEEPKEKSIKDMTKKEFDEYALTKFNIKLNRTYTKKNMIKQFNKEMNKK